MSTTPKLFKLFIFFVLIIKIVNCGNCCGTPQVYEGNNDEDNNNVGRGGNFAGFAHEEVLNIGFNLASSNESECFSSDNDETSCDYDDDTDEEF
uniref:Uncharacterized protein n=1 Tax=Meloidogyne enterolobii TaxID=390850 RepID=A0A6V7XFV4_MELEN|nr:unnamed protein product [Meloidogyne enterolobii]